MLRARHFKRRHPSQRRRQQREWNLRSPPHPGHAGACACVVFIYEAAKKPGETVVGYRKPMLVSGGEASRIALADIDALLDGIVKDAVK
jgi:hypothetical protein